MNSIIGKTVLGYEVKEKIGAGGFGNVYRVEKNNIVGNVTRALKVITLPRESQYIEILNSMGGNKEKTDAYFRDELNRVVNEIRVFSMISEKDNHNIVSYYENDIEKVGDYEYNIYILMELLTPLNRWLQNNPLTVEKGLEIALSVAKGLKICHENKIMHRDVKLNNIFVSKDGKFKLGDFGVSKRFDTMTKAHTIKGTPYYIAPEVYLGKQKYDNSVDIYSMGILLYYLFNNSRYPFYPDYPEVYNQADEDRAFYRRMNYEQPAKPVHATDSIAKIIFKLLARPEERYEKISEVITELETVRQELSKEELETVIRMFSREAQKEEANDSKEQKLVNQLEESTIASISFGEYSVEEKRKEKNGNNEKTKILVQRMIGGITAVLVVVMLLLIIGNGMGIKERLKTRPVQENISAVGTESKTPNKNVVTSTPKNEISETNQNTPMDQNENTSGNNNDENTQVSDDKETATDKILETTKKEQKKQSSHKDSKTTVKAKETPKTTTKNQSNSKGSKNGALQFDEIVN